MSYGLTINDWNDPASEPIAQPLPTGALGVSDWGLTVLPDDAPAQFQRSALIPVAFLIPTLVSGLSYASGGVAFLSDAAFLFLTGLCLVLVGIELKSFRHRMGIGAILLYGGVLIWFCHDYATNWLGHDFNHFQPYFPLVKLDTVARALFYHCLFINLMAVAIRFPVFRVVDKLVVAVPEPADPRFYVALVIAMFAFGMSAFWFTSDKPLALARACLWFIPKFAGPIPWTVGRDGNFASGLGSYVAQIIQVGQVGGLVACAYAVLIARSMPGRVFGWWIWSFWTLFSFTSYRRGDIAFMALPVVGLMFVKFHAQLDPERRARNFFRLCVTGCVVLTVWFFVQYQTSVRMGGRGVSMFRAAGNTMFSEGLNAWVVIPGGVGFAYDDWPGETIVRPLPDTLWGFVIGPIPRILWKSKPVEYFNLWYSAMISHDRRGINSGGAQGSTVSGGAVGAWYFRYGPAGVIEGALVYGWLMGVAERALRRAQGRPIKILFSLAFATFIFRSYRDLWWQILYPIMIGGVVLWIIIRLMSGGKSETSPAASSTTG